MARATKHKTDEAEAKAAAEAVVTEAPTTDAEPAQPEVTAVEPAAPEAEVASEEAPTETEAAETEVAEDESSDAAETDAEPGAEAELAAEVATDPAPAAVEDVVFNISLEEYTAMRGPSDAFSIGQLGKAIGTFPRPFNDWEEARTRTLGG